MNAFFNLVHRLVSFVTRAVLVIFVTAILGIALLIIATAPRLRANSIVKVLNMEGTGGGTGWVAQSSRGKVIVTNDHVCEVAKGGIVRVDADDGTPALKRILRRDFERDLCVLEGIDRPALTVASQGPARFDRVKVLGHPGLRPTAPAEGVYTGMGIVPIGFSPDKDGDCSESAEKIDSFFGSYCILHMELGYTTVPIMPGNSGSPITNENGEVIGVINSVDSRGNQGMFVPLQYLKDILTHE